MRDKRLDRARLLLSARERALLTLRDFKAGKPQDRALLQVAPNNQTRELNRLIGLMNAANGPLALLIVIIRERAQKEELRLGWLAWVRICALEMWCVRAQFNVGAREPITESEYRARQAEAAGELIPIDDCATILTEAYDGWKDADLEPDEDGGLTPTDEAWYRMQRLKKKELRELVASGVLVAKGKPPKIGCGPFYDWLGVPVPVVPEFGLDCEVRPDAQAPEVKRARRDQALLQKLFEKAACKLDLPLDMERPLVVEPTPGFGEELARVLAVTIRAGVQENWRELRAIGEQIDEITEAFDGEDVLRDSTRGYLEEAKGTLAGLREDLQAYTGPFELPDPDDEVRATVARIVEQEVRNVSAG